MPVLNWIGKDKVVNHDKELPFRVLKQNKKLSGGELVDEVRTYYSGGDKEIQLVKYLLLQNDNSMLNSSSGSSVQSIAPSDVPVI